MYLATISPKLSLIPHFVFGARLPLCGCCPQLAWDFVSVPCLDGWSSTPDTCASKFIVYCQCVLIQV